MAPVTLGKINVDIFKSFGAGIQLSAMLDTRKLFLKYYGRKFNSRSFQLRYMYLNIFDFF